MNDLISLAYSTNPNDSIAVNVTVTPMNSDGSINIGGIASTLIHGPSTDAAEDALLDSIEAALATFRTAKSL
jgi:hypothetical protein